jgi:hypothetical protein
MTKDELESWLRKAHADGFVSGYKYMGAVMKLTEGGGIAAYPDFDDSQTKANLDAYSDSYNGCWTQCSAHMPKDGTVCLIVIRFGHSQFISDAIGNHYLNRRR